MNVQYLCEDCGSYFFLDQGDPSPDDEVSYCWDCIDKMLGRDGLE